MISQFSIALTSNTPQPDLLFTSLIAQFGEDIEMKHGRIVCQDEELALRIANVIHGLGGEPTVWFKVLYSAFELESAELLCASIYPEDGGQDLVLFMTDNRSQQLPHERTWRREIGCDQGPICFRMADAGTMPFKLRMAYPGGTMVISEDLRRSFEHSDISGLSYHPLHIQEETLAGLPVDRYYLAITESDAPPLETSVLVEPWSLARGKPNRSWNFPPSSRLRYDKLSISAFRDFNELRISQLGKRVSRRLIVRQRVRQIFERLGLTQVEYEPIDVTSEGNNEQAQPTHWSWTLGTPRKELITLAEAERRYGSPED